MIKIGIDISTTSTAIVVNEDDKQFKYFNITDHATKYHKNSKNITSYVVEKIIKSDDYLKEDRNKQYSTNELNKLKKYKSIESKLAFILEKYRNEEIAMNIEGYSYSSKAGNIIDIVTLSTILRLKCLEYTSNINIIAPQSLKKQVLTNSYKKDKYDMMNKFIEDFDDETVSIYSEIKAIQSLKLKAIPSPYTDIIDAFWLCYLI
jgi:hypothetical protein